MRLNRSTLLLLLVSVLVIAAVLFLSRDEAQEPAVVTPVVDETSGPLLPGLAEQDVASVALQDNASGDFIRLTREGEDWAVSGPADEGLRTVDQAAAQLAVNNLLELAINRSFEIDDLATFGLVEPTFTLEVDRGEGPLEVIFVGRQNPQGTRHYVMTRQLDVVAGAFAAAPDLAQGSLVQLVNSRPLEEVLDLLDEPPWQPLPSATPLPTATLNPMSEVEMATAAAAAQASSTAALGAVLATLTAEATLTPAATPEAAG